MKTFVVGGLDTPQKKAEAEVILQKLGCVSKEEWNNDFRNDEDCTFIERCSNGNYQYHNHACSSDHITLDDLRAMLTNQPEPIKPEPTMKTMLIINDEHQVDYRVTIRDGVYSLYTSKADHWNDPYKDNILLKLTDDGNGVKLSKSMKKMDYCELHELEVLLNVYRREQLNSDKYHIAEL